MGWIRENEAGVKGGTEDGDQKKSMECSNETRFLHYHLKWTVTLKSFLKVQRIRSQQKNGDVIFGQHLISFSMHRNQEIL